MRGEIGRCSRCGAERSLGTRGICEDCAWWDREQDYPDDGDEQRRLFHLGWEMAVKYNSELKRRKRGRR